MHKLFIAVVVLFIVGSCRERVEKAVDQDASRFEIVTDEWPKKIAVDPKVNAILREWPEFIAMDISFDAIYNAVNREDLSLTIENIIEEQKLLEDSTYPKEFDIPQIKSRQKVFKTYVLKVKGDLTYYLDPTSSVHEMIEAYNLLREKCNGVVYQTLDAKLILEDE